MPELEEPDDAERRRHGAHRDDTDESGGVEETGPPEIGVGASQHRGRRGRTGHADETEHEPLPEIERTAVAQRRPDDHADHDGDRAEDGAARTAPPDRQHDDRGR